MRRRLFLQGLAMTALLPIPPLSAARPFLNAESFAGAIVDIETGGGAFTWVETASSGGVISVWMTTPNQHLLFPNNLLYRE